MLSRTRPVEKLEKKSWANHYFAHNADTFQIFNNAKYVIEKNKKTCMPFDFLILNNLIFILDNPFYFCKIESKTKC